MEEPKPGLRRPGGGGLRLRCRKGGVRGGGGGCRGGVACRSCRELLPVADGDDLVERRVALDEARETLREGWVWGGGLELRRGVGGGALCPCARRRSSAARACGKMLQNNTGGRRVARASSSARLSPAPRTPSAACIASSSPPPRTRQQPCGSPPATPRTSCSSPPAPSPACSCAPGGGSWGAAARGRRRP